MNEDDRIARLTKQVEALTVQVTALQQATKKTTTEVTDILLELHRHTQHPPLHKRRLSFNRAIESGY
jgi:hypothetical protein